MSEQSINGWKPPLVKDYGSGGKRIATQEDIDNLELIAHAYAQLYRDIEMAMRVFYPGMGNPFKPAANPFQSQPEQEA